MVPLAEMSVAQWHEVMDANARRRRFIWIKEVWPVMKRQFEARGRGAKGGDLEGHAAGGVIVLISVAGEPGSVPRAGGVCGGEVGGEYAGLGGGTGRGGGGGYGWWRLRPGATETPEMLRKIPGVEKMPKELILEPGDVAGMVGEVVGGALRHCSGETLFVHAGPA